MYLNVKVYIISQFASVVFKVFDHVNVCLSLHLVALFIECCFVHFCNCFCTADYRLFSCPKTHILGIMNLLLSNQNTHLTQFKINVNHV